MNVDKCHRALLSLAEEFRTKSPPDLKSSMQCLLAILNLPVPPHIIAQTNYKLGSFIYKYTFDTNVAQTYLERAYEQAQVPELTQTRLQIVAVLVDIYLSTNHVQSAKQLLTRAINDTTTGAGGHLNLYWHYRFLFKLAHLNLDDGDYNNANNLCTIGAQTAGATDDLFSRVLFLLSKVMVLMIARKYPNSINPQMVNGQHILHEQQLVDTIALASNLLDSWQGDFARKEGLKVFLLILQVCHHSNKGQNKSARPCVRLLQQSIQNIQNAVGQNPVVEEAKSISANMSENFTWLPHEHMCLIVFVVSVLHSLLAGSYDKAQRYTERILAQIDRMRIQSSKPDTLLESSHIIILEHMSMVNLVMGSRVTAIKQIVQAMQLCSRGHLKLKMKHKGVMRTLLGFYAMSMSMIDEAAAHFGQVMDDNNNSTDIRVMAMLNLALCYLQDDTRRNERRNEVEALLNRLSPEQVDSLTDCLKAAAYYVYGLKAFCDDKSNDAKRNLRVTLRLANNEDLNRLTACTLVLLGKIFNNSELPRESLNMVTPAMKLAGKIPDKHVQLWASSVMRDIYAREIHSPQHAEYANISTTFSNQLYQDKMQAFSLPEHNYINWQDW